MPRATNKPASHSRRRKVIKLAKGYWGVRKNRFRSAKQAIMKAGVNAYRDRRRKKRDFRRLWITRISAACKSEGISYSKFLYGLSKKGILINRKMLADMAVNDQEAFSKLMEITRSAEQ
ncbi:MAG: 50S ribosomal protein L20 [Desulfuromonas sp. SDB]|nr:MAG: 50S ribosomal protein L20 [Desulfuromonas sp. SDB]